MDLVKLLLVDDSRAARMLIKSILLDYDPEMELLEAADGEEALVQYSQEQPEIVFLDLTMPVMGRF